MIKRLSPLFLMLLWCAHAVSMVEENIEITEEVEENTEIKAEFVDLLNNKTVRVYIFTSCWAFLKAMEEDTYDPNTYPASIIEFAHKACNDDDMEEWSDDLDVTDYYTGLKQSIETEDLPPNGKERTLHMWHKAFEFFNNNDFPLVLPEDDIVLDENHIKGNRVLVNLNRDVTVDEHQKKMIKAFVVYGAYFLSENMSTIEDLAVRAHNVIWNKKKKVRKLLQKREDLYFGV